MLLALALPAVSVHAQCLGAPTGAAVTLTPTSWWPADDEGFTSPAVPIGFTFPMAGALPLAPGATHLFAHSNGEIYLTNATYGLAAPVNPALFGITSTAAMRGTQAGASPRICAFGNDYVAGSGNYAIRVDSSVAGECRISWTDCFYWGASPVGSFSSAIVLHDDGRIDLEFGDAASYEPKAYTTFCGVSIGDGVGSSTQPRSDLSNGADSGALGLLFEYFTLSEEFDLAGKIVTLTPNGSGGYTSSLSCINASHLRYGAGCYDSQPLRLSATPDPVHDPVSGVTVTYAVDNVPQASPTAGLHVAVVFLSSAPASAVDLGFLGAPGCFAHIASLDIALSPGQITSPSQNVSVLLPPGLPLGVDIWAQAMSLVVPGTLPNGQNAAGLVTSNGLRTHVESF